jgi:hypothetical protein
MQKKIGMNLNDVLGKVAIIPVILTNGDINYWINHPIYNGDLLTLTVVPNFAFVFTYGYYLLANISREYSNKCRRKCRGIRVQYNRKSDTYELLNGTIEFFSKQISHYQ